VTYTDKNTDYKVLLVFWLLLILDPKANANPNPEPKPNHRPQVLNCNVNVMCIPHLHNAECTKWREIAQ